MRDQLIQYVDLLFAGTSGAEDIKQEILQNTLDRFDDLIAQGKSEQAAYQLAISGIGDVQEILNSQLKSAPTHAVPVHQTAAMKGAEAESNPKWVKAVAIALFILSAIPLLILQNTIGLCLCIAVVAAGVVLLVGFGKEERKQDTGEIPAQRSRRSPINRGINGGMWGAGLCVYFLLSFSTGDWHMTWLIFPIIGCLCGLVNAVFDLKRSLVSAVIRIILFALLLLVLATCIFGMMYSFSFTEGWFSVTSTGDYVSGEGGVDAAAVKNIDVEWVAGSITILPGDTDEITFTETAHSEKAKPLIWEQKGDTLRIRFCEPTISIGINLGTTVNVASKDLVISVPREWVGSELTIDSVSATIEVSDLKFQEIELNNVSGECTFENCSVDDLSLETVSGGVDYRGSLNTLDCDSVSADCEIYAANHPRQIDMDGVSCDLVLFLPEECGFTVEMDSMSGDISSDFPTTVKNGNYIYGDGSCRIEADSMSGDIIIRKAD